MAIKNRGNELRGTEVLRCGARTPAVRLRGQGTICLRSYSSSTQVETGRFAPQRRTSVPHFVLLRSFQRGATLPLVIFLLTGLLGAASLAIDLRLMGLAKQRAQAVADAAALAGAASPGASGAAVASVIAANNGSGAVFTSTAVSPGANGAVSVQGTVNAPLSFAPAVGFTPHGSDGSANTVTVSASATADMLSVCGLPVGMPIAPFGLIGDDPTNTDPAVVLVSALLAGTKTLTSGVYQAAGTQIMLRLNVWNQSGTLSSVGSFDPLTISGTGAGYQSTILHLSDQPLSAGQALSTPALAYDSTALTRQGISARLAPSNTQFTHLSATYDAWFNGHQETTDAHLMLVPVISQAVRNKPGNVTLIGFATFFISQPAQDTSNAIVYGRFLGLTLPGASAGVCADAGTLTPARLTQ